MSACEVADELERIAAKLRQPDKPDTTQAEIACGMFGLACHLRDIAWRVEDAMLEITDNL